MDTTIEPIKYESILNDTLIKRCAATVIEHVKSQYEIEDASHAIVNQVQIETDGATPIREIKIAINTLTLYVRAETNSLYLEKLEKERKETECTQSET